MERVQKTKIRDNTTVDNCVIFTALILVSALFSSLANNKPEKPIIFESIKFSGIPAKDLYIELPDIDYEPEPTMLNGLEGVLENYTITPITVREMELTEIGTYFITAYCPAECGGSWATASGATCHRADWENRYDEPTTVAIDRRYHSFGEEFYIEEFDRVFVAEDTGSGVKGQWLDIFYEDYDDVLSFPTGYYTVYSVEWVEVTYYEIEYVN